MALIHEDITSDILACAIEVRRLLAPGLLESSSEACLAFELGQMERRVARRVPLPIPPSHSASLAPWFPVALRGECS